MTEPQAAEPTQQETIEELQHIIACLEIDRLIMLMHLDRETILKNYSATFGVTTLAGVLLTLQSMGYTFEDVSEVRKLINDRIQMFTEWLFTSEEPAPSETT